MSSKTLTLCKKVLGKNFKTIEELLEKLTFCEKCAIIAEALKD